jgi:hypothetical protein
MPTGGMPDITEALATPTGGVLRLEEATGFAFPNLAAARERTERRVAEVSRALAATPESEGVSTCVFGSWARAELTDESDDDWAVLVSTTTRNGGTSRDGDAARGGTTRGDSGGAARGGGTSRDGDGVAAWAGPVDTEIAAAAAELGGGDRRPGAQGVFGEPVNVADLVGNIGLDADTNTNFTRRMLLLLESRELHGAVRRQAIDQILSRYLSDSRPGQPPRFLLNDVVRYWRTICVDFEGKAARGGPDPKWASRNAKLRTSRKLLFAAGLLPVLLCQLHDTDPAAFLARWFDAPALDRISTTFLFAGLPDAGVRALSAYDRWIELMAHRDIRAELAQITYATRDASVLYSEIKDLGRVFEDALGALLFSPLLGRLTRTYVIF